MNFMELIGESMGISEQDLYWRLKIVRDVDAVMAERRDNITLYGLDEETVRAALLTEYWSEQPVGIPKAPFADAPSSLARSE